MDQAGASGDQFGDLHGLILEKSTRGFLGKKKHLGWRCFFGKLASAGTKLFFDVKMSDTVVQILINYLIGI